MQVFIRKVDMLRRCVALEISGVGLRIGDWIWNGVYGYGGLVGLVFGWGIERGYGALAVLRKVRLIPALDVRDSLVGHCVIIG